MFKIIVADDEAIFREYMRTLIDWEQHGFRICCEARNGIEALEMINVHKPDIALVDINMPYLDGLSLVQKINELQEDMAIILITGHSEFEYARKAVKLGVVDYILKPFRKEELLMTLLKIKGSLQRLHDEKDEEKSYLNLMRERLLNILISGELKASEDEIMIQLKRFSIVPSSSYFVVASIEVDNMYSMWNDAEEILLWKFAISNILIEVMDFENKHIVFNGPEGRIIAIVELDKYKEDETKESEGVYIDKFRHVCKLVKKYLKFTITIGIGNPVNGIRNIRDSYLESLAALQNKVIAIGSKVLLFSDLGTESMSIGFYQNEVNEKLILALRTNSSEDITRLLSDVFKFMKDKKLSFEYVFSVVMGLVSLCLSYINEIDKNVDKVFGKDFSPYIEIRNKTSLDALYKWTVEIFEKTLAFSEESRYTKSKVIVDSVREYIEKNYHNSSLSVEGIACEFYINSSYLRRIFRKELDMSVNDYIVDIRMQKAKELIGHGNTRLSDISEMVGYNDTGYFSKSFKKKFGFSPSEYENIKNR